jgi:magnesium transporter
MAPSRNPEDRPVAALLAPDIVALLEESPTTLAVETEEMHPADLADVAELLEPEQLKAFLDALGPSRAADVLEYLDEELRTEFLETITPRQAAEIVTEMTPDDRADILEEIEEERAEEILSEIPSEARREVEKLLAYDPDSAGGLMTTEFVSVSADMTVEAALENVRQVARSGQKEAMHNIYTTDAQGRVAGVMSLRELLAAPSGAKISDIAWTEGGERPARRRPRRSRARDHQLRHGGRAGGQRVRARHGRDHRDDVIDAIQEEQTEDVQKLGGMEASTSRTCRSGSWR